MSFSVDVVEGVRIALFSLAANRLRTLLTTAAIGIGVATLLAILGIVQGLSSAFERQLESVGPHTLFVGRYKWGYNMNDWWESRNRKELTLEQAKAIRTQSTYTTAVAPVANTTVEISFRGRQLPQVISTGTNEDFLEVSGYELASGRFISAIDGESRARVVVLTADPRDTLFPNMDPIGLTVLVNNHPFRVIGTLKRKGKVLESTQDRSVMMPYKTQLATLGKPQFTQFVVGTRGPDVVNKAEDEVVGILRRARQTPPDKPNDFVINRTEHLMALYNRLTSALYGVVVGIGLITLLVGGIGIMNIMLVSVRERTREIGIRRALGARRRTIVLQFLLEATAVSAAGSTLGTVVGLSIAQVISLVTPLAAAIKPSTVVLGIGFAAVMGLLFGIWPAARAAACDPVEALRYE
jgi:putative ABC transport system permease protein